MRHKETYTESLTDLLIATLTSARNVRRFHSILAERKFNRYREGSIRVALSRLHKKRYIQRSSVGWSITSKGKAHMKNLRLLNYLRSPFKENSPSHTIVAFDIPEKDRIMRAWLRNQIKIFGYTMLQQSLWVGPGPLPLIFLKRLEDLGIRKNIKIFKISKKT